MTRTTFSEVEIAYLASQRLGRIATVDRHGAPRVAPIGFRYNPETGTIDCGGHNFAATYRYRDIQADPRVAITIDDLASIQPWRPRAVLVRGSESTPSWREPVLLSGERSAIGARRDRDSARAIGSATPQNGTAIRPPTCRVALGPRRENQS